MRSGHRKQRIAVRVCRGHRLRGENAAGARPVVRDDLLLPALRESPGHDACRCVDGAARSETDHETAVVQLRAVASGWWSYLRTERFQVVQRLVMADLPQFPDLMQFYAEEVVARGRRLIAGIVSRGIALGEFRVVDPESAARMLSALAMTHSQWCSRRQFFPALMQRTDDEVRDELIDFYLHALRPGLPVDASVSPSSTS